MRKLPHVMLVLAGLTGCSSFAAQTSSIEPAPGPPTGLGAPTSDPIGLTGLRFFDDMALGLKERGTQNAVFYRIVGRGLSETGAKPYEQLTLGDTTWTAWFMDPKDEKSYRATPGSGVRAIVLEETDPALAHRAGYALDRQAILVDSHKAARLWTKPSPGGDVTLMSAAEYRTKTGKETSSAVWALPYTLNTGATGTFYIDTSHARPVE